MWFYNVMVFYHSGQLLKYTRFLNMIFHFVDFLELCVLISLQALMQSLTQHSKTDRKVSTSVDLSIANIINSQKLF